MTCTQLYWIAYAFGVSTGLGLTVALFGLWGMFK